MKAEVKSILPIVNKVYREWRKGYGPVIIRKNLSAKFARMMKSQYGVSLNFESEAQVIVRDIEIVDEGKYIMLLLRWS